MRCDSIEIGWVRKDTRQRRTHDAATAVTDGAPRTCAFKPDAADEAFASFAGSVSEGKTPSVDRTLVTSLAAQHDALDRQREHLANLLRSIEVRSETSPGAAL
jgi:hypothetical protein